MPFKKILAGALVTVYTVVSGGNVTAQIIGDNHTPSCPVVNQDKVEKRLNGMYLSYIRSSSDYINQSTEGGLLALSKTLIKKTSLEKSKTDLKDVVSLDIECEDLSLSHFIYWPVGVEDKPLSEVAQKKLQSYIDKGGFIVIDLLDFDSTQNDLSELKKITGDVRFGGMVPVTKDHTLLQTFYRVSNLRGSYILDSPLVQSHSIGEYKKPTSVVIGSNNWAQAWSGLTLGEGTKPHVNALRVGVNFVLYAFTGEYKSDQFKIQQTLDNIKKIQ